MKLHFDPDQPHQQAAIEAVMGLLLDQPFVSTAEALAAGRGVGVVANRLDVSSKQLLERARATQRAAGLPELTAWPDPDQAPQISVEMETGTGKTYVYLRTILALSRRHGIRKVVVVVPSVAVREGVLKTLRITQDHFSRVLPGIRYRFFAYDGARLARLRTFARSSEVELMVLTLDAFNKARNRMRQPHDAFGGRTPLELVQATRPLVVLDEPQRMESPRSRAALADLRPLLTLRYSATHRRRHALVHRLTPRQAHAQGLVKRIEVAAPAAGLTDRGARILAQLRTTIALHLRRQAQLRARGIKVLSLLFVPQVADWVAEDGLVRAHFGRGFNELKGEYPDFAALPADRVCAAYFATRASAAGRGQAIDSRTGRSAADEDAYALIMRDKERLLSFEEPVCFVVSHSALREGWDNPNVFQICTMATSHSTIKKRQEVGRGVRLAVDQQGRRVFDRQVNVLTVIANDSYEEYVEGLQREDAQIVGEDAVAPAPRRVGEGARRDRETIEPTAASLEWQAIDVERLRADAVALVERSGSVTEDGREDGEPVADPVMALRTLLLQRRPPCLVSRRTMELVLDGHPRAGGRVHWAQIEDAAQAIVLALGRQHADD
ncbi:MAG: DEAD/DEAH box helicase family protein [Myxococcota bacterium]